MNQRIARFLSVLFLWLLSACGNFATTATAISTPTFTLIPTSTVTPLPTETSTPVFPFPAEAQTWVVAHPEFNLSGQLDANGFYVDLGDGKRIDVPADQIAARIKVGQEGALQVYSETGDKIIAAYDPETKAWINRDKVVAKDFFNMETYIHVQTWEQAKELFRLEKHFMIPFPEGTQFPTLDEKQADYLSGNTVSNPLGDFPIGKEPVKLFNGIIIEKNEPDGINADYVAMTSQVYNIDGSFSSFQAGRTKYDFERMTLRSLLLGRSYILPVYDLGDGLNYVNSNYQFNVKTWVDNGLYDGNGRELTKIKSFVIQWLRAGKFPKELKNIFLIDSPKLYR
jgi:hypothetical protein